jgi:hypothetical protein
MLASSFWPSLWRAYNRFLECAEAADADYLVDRQQAHFPKQWKQCIVIGARELVELLIDARRKK